MHSAVNRSNSFDFIRLSAALLVLASHAYAIAGRPEPRAGELTSLGGLGVAIFFAISGYLISASWLSDPHPARFALRRCLRIFPGLSLVILLSVFALGPMVTALPVGAYFHDHRTYQYLTNVCLYVRYGLPGCFNQAPVAGVVNGSIWSLPVEFLMYAVLGLLGFCRLVKRRPLMVCFTALICVADLYLSNPAHHPQPVVFWGMELHQILVVAPYFWVGSLFYLYRDRLRLTLNITILVFMIAVLIHGGSAAIAWSWFAIPYITLAFCTQRERHFRIPERLGDLSYGIYIYAFPIEQLVYREFHDRLSVGKIALISAILSSLCAFVSWRLVEQPMLRLKPGRRPLSLAYGQLSGDGAVVP